MDYAWAVRWPRLPVPLTSSLAPWTPTIRCSPVLRAWDHCPLRWQHTSVVSQWFMRSVEFAFLLLPGETHCSPKCLHSAGGRWYKPPRGETRLKNTVPSTHTQGRPHYLSSPPPAYPAHSWAPQSFALLGRACSAVVCSGTSCDKHPGLKLVPSVQK